MPPSHPSEGLRSVPAGVRLVRPGRARGAVGGVYVDEPGVDLLEAVGRLLDAGVRPRPVEQLGDAVGRARRVLRGVAPVALAGPELVQAAELGGADIVLGVGPEGV